MRCPLSLNSEALSKDPLVWLYEANRLVVPAPTTLWEKIHYFTTRVHDDMETKWSRIIYG